LRIWVRESPRPFGFSSSNEKYTFEVSTNCSRSRSSSHSPMYRSAVPFGVPYTFAESMKLIPWSHAASSRSWASSRSVSTTPSVSLPNRHVPKQS
jgi:hypothetical protein